MSAFDPIAYINERRPQKERMCPERMEALLESMGRPQDRLKFVHVAGTNGKGSTCAYLASILQAAGYRTGLFTSPYIVEFAERIRVDGQNIPLESLTEVTLFVREHVEAYAAKTGEYPTEFEVMCAVAFEHFARSTCDIVVCEVGLGGRRDPTNVIRNVEVSIIARLGLDHQDLLGHTLTRIAYEKAGIIKPQVPVVVYPQDSADAMHVIEQQARAQEADMVVPDHSTLRVDNEVHEGARLFEYAGASYRTKLVAAYQPRNATLALEAVRVLRKRGWAIPEDAVREGIANAYWPGRFELVEYGGGCLLIDGAHNTQGAQALRESLDIAFPNAAIVFVTGVLQDKDYRSVLRCVLPRASAVVCMTPPSPRALPAQDLVFVVQEELDSLQVHDDIPVVAAEDVQNALDTARALGGSDAVVCAFGSLYLVGEVERVVRGL